MKNLKMFAIAVMAFAVMAMGVHADECADNVFIKGDKECYAKLSDALNNSNGDTNFTLLNNIVVDSTETLTVSSNVTIDLKDNNITFQTGAEAKGFVVSGGNLTLKGTGTIKSAANATASLIAVSNGHNLTVNGVKLEYNVATSSKTTPAISITGTNNAYTNVSFDKDVKVTSNGYGLALLGTTAQKVKVDMAGTWETDVYVVKVNGTIGYAASNVGVINIASGTYTSKNGTALYASGYATWNISGGEITGAQALEVRSGTVNIKGGNLKATGVDGGSSAVPTSSPHALKNGAAINVVNGDSLEGTQTGTDYPNAQRTTVNVSGGTITSEKGYAMYLKNLGEYGKIAISGDAKLTSANDNRGQLAAIKIDEDTKSNTDFTSVKAFIENHKDMVKGGTFTGDVFEKLNTSANTYATPADLAKELVEGEVNVTDGNTTVEGDGEQNPEGQPGTTEPGNTGDGNQGGTDNVKNPETNDNILVYAGLGLVSLASVAFTAKKRED